MASDFLDDRDRDVAREFIAGEFDQVCRVVYKRETTADADGGTVHGHVPEPVLLIDWYEAGDPLSGAKLRLNHDPVGGVAFINLSVPFTLAQLEAAVESISGGSASVEELSAGRFIVWGDTEGNRLLGENLIMTWTGDWTDPSGRVLEVQNPTFMGAVNRVPAEERVVADKVMEPADFVLAHELEHDDRGTVRAVVITAHDHVRVGIESLGGGTPYEVVEVSYFSPGMVAGRALLAWGEA